MADESRSTLSVNSATAAGTGGILNVQQTGAGTAVQVNGGGTLLDVRTQNGTPRLVVAQAAPVITGAKGSNAALGSLLTALVGMGLITDTTTT